VLRCYLVRRLLCAPLLTQNIVLYFLTGQFHVGVWFRERYVVRDLVPSPVNICCDLHGRWIRPRHFNEKKKHCWIFIDIRHYGSQIIRRKSGSKLEFYKLIPSRYCVIKKPTAHTSCLVMEINLFSVDSWNLRTKCSHPHKNPMLIHIRPLRDRTGLAVTGHTCVIGHFFSKVINSYEYLTHCDIVFEHFSH
jgi:hypothetical protein